MVQSIEWNAVSDKFVMPRFLPPCLIPPSHMHLLPSPHAAAAIMAPRFANRMNWFYAYDDVVRTMYAPPTLFCTISGENITTHSVMIRMSLPVIRMSLHVIRMSLHVIRVSLRVMIQNITHCCRLSTSLLYNCMHTYT